MAGHLFLIGGRASGKTSLAHILAGRLGLDWTDTDDELKHRIGQSIAEFVGLNGWDRFRDEETAALAAVCSGPPKVVACGGGIVLREANCRLMAQGTVFYLKADPEVLARRLMADPNEAQRPSLTGQSIQEEVRSVMTEREPLYQRCANVVLDASLPLERLADATMNALRMFQEGR